MTGKNIDRGISFLARRNYLKAKDEFEKIIKKDPENEIGLFYTAVSYYELGDIGKCIEYLKKILTLDENFTACYIVLGLISAEKWINTQSPEKDKFLKEAIHYYECAYRLSPDDNDIKDFLKMLKVFAS